jgi:hypothetical protein
MPSGRFARLWSARLVWHVLALAVVLVAGAWISDPGSAWSSDEGAALIQVDLLLDGTWSYRYPYPDLGGDVLDEAAPFEHGDVTPSGEAPFAKHPVYPILLMPFHVAFGPWGYVLPSMIGTLVAALVAGRLSNEISPGGERATLWLVGLASPLYFDSFVALGHTLAAAAGSIAALAVVRGIQGSWRPVPATLGVAAAAALGVTWRSEAVFIGVGLFVAAAFIAWREPAVRSRAAWVGGGAVLGVTAAFVAEWVARRAIVGGAPQGTVPRTHGRWLVGRADGIVATWLDPSYDAGSQADLMLSLAVVALVGAFVAIRLGRWEAARVAAVVAVVGYTLRIVLAPPATIPGLILACPWILALVWLRRTDLRSLSARVIGIAAVVSTTGILLTQHSRGGGQEWGGRYFAVVLPLVAPLVVMAVRSTAARWSPAQLLDPVLVLCSIIIGASLLFVGFEELRNKHLGADRAAATLALVEERNPEVARPPGGGPIVFTPGERLVPQILWPVFDEYTWVSPDGETSQTYADRLAATGSVPVLGFAADRQVWEGLGWDVIDTEPFGRREIVVVQPSS